MKNTKTKRKSVTALRKKAWKLKSELVRRKADGVCFTCGAKNPWKECHAGHYIHKDCLDYDEIGIQCQCVACNKWRHGNLGIYGEKLIHLFGMQAVETLRMRGNEGHKFTIIEIEAIIEKLKEELQAL